MSSGDTTHGVGEQFKLLESLLQQLLQKDAITPPQITNKKDIKTHLEKVGQYFKVCGITTEESKIAILFNTLSDDMRFELCGALEFKAHENDYPWIENKLLELFNPKESEIAPLVKLFHCKQGTNQTVREFLSEIRIEGYKLLKNIDPEEREKHLIDAFTKGLLSEELRSALGRKKVGTLDEAYRLVKKERQTNEIDYVRKIEAKTDHSNEIEQLQNQVLMVQKQLSYIVAILERTADHRTTYADMTCAKRRKDEMVQNPPFLQQVPTQQRQQFPSQQRNNGTTQCWNCGLNGHIARFCRANKCSSCGRFGHAAQNCRSKGKPRRLRRMWEDKGAEEWETDITDEPLSDVSSQEKDTRGVHDIPEVCALTIHARNTKAVTTMEKRKVMKEKRYPQYITEMAEYVEGRRSKKDTLFPKEETLIEDNYKEKARNKPLVRGTVEGKHSKLFLDTGAEINVIDEGFIQQLKGQPIRRHKQRKVIRCANDSRMDTKGWVRLRVRIGGQTKQCKFWVVQNLFPKVIVGIRAMKDMCIAVDPAKECIWADGVRVPLLARVQPQSLQGSERSSGNAF